VRSYGARTYYVNRVKVEGDLDAAKDRKAEIDKAKRRGERIVPKSEIPNVAPLLDEYMASKTRLRPWTLSCYQSANRLVHVPRFGDLKASAVGPDDLAKLNRDLESRGLNAIDPTKPVRPLSAKTIENYSYPLRGALDLAVRRGYIAKNPYDLLTPDERPQKGDRKQHDDLGEESFEKLIATAESRAQKREAQQDWSDLFYVAGKTTARMGELLGLDWSHVDLKAGTISVERQLTRTGELAAPKTKQAVRVIPISDDVVARLRRLRGDVLRQPDEHVFASLTGGRLGHRNVQRAFDAATEEAGLEGLTFHSLRHLAISRLIASGLDAVTVAKLAGHKDARITLSTYAHVFDAQSQKKQDAIRAAMGGASS
jgi:integrase